jgi:hypothetical protein
MSVTLSSPELMSCKSEWLRLVQAYIGIWEKDFNLMGKTEGGVG